MVDVTHDRDDRWTKLEQIDGFFGDDFRLLDDDDLLVDTLFLVAFFTLENEAVDFANFCCDVRLKGLIGSWEDADFDQVRHDVERLEPETGGQIWNQDRGFDDDEFGIITYGFSHGLVLDGSGLRGDTRRSLFDFCGDWLCRCHVLFVEDLGDCP